MHTTATRPGTGTPDERIPLTPLVINGVMLMLTARLASVWNLGFTVDGFWPAFWGGLVVGVVSLMLALLVSGDQRPGPG